MTWFEFIAAVVAVLAWPAAILTIALVLRSGVRKAKPEANEGDDQ